MPSHRMINKTRKRKSTPRITTSTGALPGDGKVFSYLTAMPRAPSSLPGEQVLTIEQTIVNTSFHSTSTTLESFASRNFSFSDIDQYAQLAAVFDQYRINSVECYLMPNGPNLNISNDGKITSVIDFDDGSALSSFGSSLDYTNALTTGCQTCHYRRFVPHIAVASYTGTFNGFSNLGHQWIDAASSSVAHFGLKTAATLTSTVATFDLVVRMNISLKSVR
jgi:hypothetical protein